MSNEHNFNSLTVETEKREILHTIYKWATHLAFEEEAKALPYIMPRPEWQTLLKRLLFSRGNLVKVVGPQGAGKTTFAYWLACNLQNAGQKTVFKKMLKGQETLGHFDTFKVPEEVELDGMRKRTIITTHKDWSWYYEDADHLIVDLWDYSKTNVKDIIKALDGIQDWWIMRSENRVKKGVEGRFIDKEVPNIIVFLQKEALPLHFFLGKMTFFELKPWSPEALIGCYRNFIRKSAKRKDFPETFPFTEDALNEIVFLSRGIFRKFKEYVAACLDTLITEAGFNINRTISLDDVKSIITTDKLFQDMELTLCELWPRNKDNRVFAVKVLRYLREHGASPQKTIATEIFDGNLMLCSRILNKLGEYNFLKMEKKGPEKVWII